MNTPYLKVIRTQFGKPTTQPDPEGTVVSREAYDALLVKLEKALEQAAINDLMAQSMVMFRKDMIEAGVVSEKCPPSFMTEGVMAHIQAMGIEQGKAILIKS
jgi:hypothetical protein